MIEAQGLTKYYGDFMGVENLNFKVMKGEVVGLLGPNGSGKTTTMRMLTGFMPPSSGTIKIAGHDMQAESLEGRRAIGYLPETVPLYTDMTVEDYLGFMGVMRGMSADRIKRRLGEVIELTKLGAYQHSHIAKLSKGYRQRVGIAQAIMHEPQVLIMDEPTVGIDPIQVVETRQLIKTLGEEHTILLSTHILPEVSMVCERVLIIHEGQLVAEDTPSNLAHRLRASDRVEVEVRGPSGEVTTALRTIQGVTNVTRTGGGDLATYMVEFRSDVDPREQIGKLVITKGWGLRKMNPLAMSLEEIFLRLTVREEGI
ncbi:MAG: ATP-binding cassette domain-containing protein [Dehalococcoidia bacterium]|nr:ATP-binding cassette domain-containing protein [Dehalococcoidia bacterium]